MKPLHLATMLALGACAAPLRQLAPEVHFFDGKWCGVADFGLQDVDVPTRKAGCHWDVTFKVAHGDNVSFQVITSDSTPSPWHPDGWRGGEVLARWVRLGDPIAGEGWNVIVDYADRRPGSADDPRVRQVRFERPWYLVFEILVATHDGVRLPRFPDVNALGTLDIDGTGTPAWNDAANCAKALQIELYTPVAERFDPGRPWKNPIANVPVFCASDRLGVMALRMDRHLREPLDALIRIKGRPYRKLRIVPRADDNYTVVRVALPDGVDS